MTGEVQTAREQNKVRVDALDEQILWELVREARIPNNALAAKLHVSPSTTLNRIRALRESGVLRSTHAFVDLDAVGLPIQAMIAVRMRTQARSHMRAYAEKVMSMPPVLAAYFLGGPDDFLIHVACTSTAHLRDFVAISLSMDPAVASTQTNIVFNYFHGAHYVDEVTGFTDMRATIADPR